MTEKDTLRISFISCQQSSKSGNFKKQLQRVCVCFKTKQEKSHQITTGKAYSAQVPTFKINFCLLKTFPSGSGRFEAHHTRERETLGFESGELSSWGRGDGGGVESARPEQSHPCLGRRREHRAARPLTAATGPRRGGTGRDRGGTPRPHPPPSGPAPRAALGSHGPPERHLSAGCRPGLNPSPGHRGQQSL